MGFLHRINLWWSLGTAVGILLVVVLGVAYPAAAEGDIQVLINDQELEFDSPPIIRNGRTLVPVRAIFEGLGARVEWRPADRQVFAVKGYHDVLLTIGETQARVDNTLTSLDVPATIIKGRTMVPLRFVSEAMGARVYWDEAARRIKITPRPWWRRPGEKLLEVHFLDVGQGDSILVKAPDGKTMLVDAGGTQVADDVVTYLKGENVEKIDVFVVTHGHGDHVGGATAVLENFKVGAAYGTANPGDAQTYRAFLDKVNELGIPFKTAYAGNKINLTAGVTVDILHPPEKAGENFGNADEGSVVLKVSYGEEGFLLTGDAGTEAEELMLDRYPQALKSTVLKVGRHGSLDSTSADFLKAVEPEAAVISVGTDNPYGYPAQTTLDRLSAAGIKVHRTDKAPVELSGTVLFTTGGGCVIFTTDGRGREVSTKPLVYVKDYILVPSPYLIHITGVDTEGEVVSVKNPAEGSFDLSGWRLVAEPGGQAFVFPDGFVLGPGETVRIWSGPGAGEALPKDLKWCEEEVWKQDVGAALLYDDSDQLIHKFTIRSGVF